VRAGGGLLAVFAKGHEHIKALVAVVTDIVISRHEFILTESGLGGGREVFLWFGLPDWIMFVKA